MITLRLFAPRILITAVVGAVLLHGALTAQRSGPPPKDFVLPDLSTIPGAITFPGDMFDLGESNFEYDGEKWLSLNVAEQTEGSASIRLPLGDAVYTVVIDAGVSQSGASTFWIEVNGTVLEEKVVKVARSLREMKQGKLLMWAETEIPAGATLTVHGKVDAVEAPDEASASARWARLLLLPHNKAPSGPPMAPPPPPPAPAAAE